MENLKFLGLEFYFYGCDHVPHAKALFPALKTIHTVRASNLVEWMEAPAHTN